MSVKQMAAMWQQRKTMQQPKVYPKSPAQQKKFQSTFVPKTNNDVHPIVGQKLQTNAKTYHQNNGSKTQIKQESKTHQVSNKPHNLEKVQQNKNKSNENIKDQSQSKIDFKSLKNKFQSMPVPGFVKNISPPLKVIKNNQNHQREDLNHSPLQVKRQQNKKPQVQIEQRQLSFQQRRKIAQQMFMKSQFNPHKLGEQNDHKQKQRDLKNQEQEKHHANENHQHHQKSHHDQKIVIKQQTYHYGQQDRNSADISQKLFQQALKITSQQQRHQSSHDNNLGGNLLTLQTRKTRAKKKRTDKDDFDDL